MSDKKDVTKEKEDDKSLMHKNKELYTKSKKTKSLASYKKATEIEPNDHEAWIGLGDSYLKDGNLTKALDSYEKARAINTKNPAILNQIGYVFSLQGDDEEALSFFEDALSIAPDYLDAKINVILVHDKLGNYDLVVKHAEEAIATNKKDNYLLFLLGNVHMG